MIKIHAQHLLTPTGNAPKRGSEMKKIYEDFDVDIFLENGKVVDIKKHSTTDHVTLEAKLVTPAFVDAHTHIPFIGKRTKEFLLRNKGKTYSEILKQGGGIYNTVNHVKKASISELVKENLKTLNLFKRFGVAYIEGKSGYGLDISTEIKQLKVIKYLNEISNVKVAPTFLGLHAIPKDMPKKTYIEKIKENLDYIKKYTNTIDVFCDKGVFLPDDIKELFNFAKIKGFKLRFHADEIENVGATKLAVNLGAISADHLLKIGDEEIHLLSTSSTIATLMPGTSFYLGEIYAPARKLIDKGAAIALGSDYNPGSCPIFNPSFIMHLALRYLKMEPEEILTAYTLNSSYVLGIENGAIQPGKYCDIALWNTEDFVDIPYMFHHNFLTAIVINGKVTFYENI
ncbi:imidazolonepropionase [Thermosipho atlanticus]|uniref:Imidazolonepropionase n=1 Tax=Thermosipho atlanticus DSM 15807 TaxID=1123380 RepID=A0A1M5RXB7_9BACT|nr:imidazolonepropionase [Thermosipho atlanticus]SHH30830.1 imidazolonepropionase [Thermosipho atlanticus DSM 15807]